MKIINLLEFLNNAESLNILAYANITFSDVNFLDLMAVDAQFVQKIDLGIMYLNQKQKNNYTIIDGLSRLTSLSLLLHAICECYKKTTEQNSKAIQTIRKKYLYNGTNIKLHLTDKEQIIYSKILNGERLSGQEKKSPIFLVLHSFWTQIKNEKLQAADIFAMLKKIYVTTVETEGVPARDLYYRLNCSKKINQINLITDYLKDKGLEQEWQVICDRYLLNNNDIITFLKDFFITKFNYKNFNKEKVYENFVNYFETMIKYLPAEIVIRNLKRTAMLYNDIINVHFKSEIIKNAFIPIKMLKGDDT